MRAEFRCRSRVRRVRERGNAGDEDAARAPGRRCCRVLALLAQAGDDVGQLVRRDVDADAPQRSDDVSARAPLRHGGLDLRQQRRNAAGLRRGIAGSALFQAGRERVRRHRDVWEWGCLVFMGVPSEFKTYTIRKQIAYVNVIEKRY